MGEVCICNDNLLRNYINEDYIMDFKNVFFTDKTFYNDLI